MNSLYLYDSELRKQYPVLRGADEAGRGPLCGPVCCAAVVLKSDFECEKKMHSGVFGVLSETNPCLTFIYNILRS